VRGASLIVAVALAAATPARAATPECQTRAAEMRDELHRTSNRLTGAIEIPSMLADWARDVVRRYEAEKDPTRRAALIADAWPKAIGTCKEPFARAFSEGAGLSPTERVAHLQRAIPDAFLACQCGGADPDALEVLMAMAVRDLAIEQKHRTTEIERAAAPGKLEAVMRKRGALFRIVDAGDSGPRCERTQFRPGRTPWKGRLGTFDYQYADGTLTLSGPTGRNIGLGCFFNARVGPAGGDAVTIDREKVFLTPAACEAARAAAPPPPPVKHLCPW
jgi:hypothetical protein